MKFCSLILYHHPPSSIKSDATSKKSTAVTQLCYHAKHKSNKMFKIERPFKCLLIPQYRMIKWRERHKHPQLNLGSSRTEVSQLITHAHTHKGIHLKWKLENTGIWVATVWPPHHLCLTWSHFHSHKENSSTHYKNKLFNFLLFVKLCKKKKYYEKTRDNQKKFNTTNANSVLYISSTDITWVPTRSQCV